MKTIFLSILCLITLDFEPQYLNNKAYNVEYTCYHSGQLIYPSYACPDTLIVTWGDGMTQEINNLINNPNLGTDSDIDSVLHIWGVKYTKLSGLQPINFESVTNPINN